MATPHKVDDRLIRFLYLLAEQQLPLNLFNQLVRDSSQETPIPPDLKKFFRGVALRLMGKSEEL